MSDFSRPAFQREVLVSVVKLCIITGVSFYTISWLLKKIDPTNNKQKQTAKLKAEQQLKRVGKSEVRKY